MSDTNVVVIKGNLVRDMELKYTAQGTAIGIGAVANNSGYSSGDGWKEHTNFVDFTMFGKRAESVAKYLTKGTPVIITGELQQDRWEKDGQKRSKIKVKVTDLSFAGSRPSGESGNGAPPDGASKGDDFEDDFPDEVPF